MAASSNGQDTGFSIRKYGFKSRCSYICPCGGMGRRICLRNKTLRVRIPSRIFQWTGNVRLYYVLRERYLSYWLISLRQDILLIHYLAASSNGQDAGFSIRRYGFKSRCGYKCPCDGIWNTYLAKNKGFGSSSLPTDTHGGFV